MPRKVINAEAVLPVPIIAVPMLPGEREQRYESRCAYLALGTARSLSRVSELLTARYGKVSKRLLQRWASEDGWVASAGWYDEQIQAMAAKVAQDLYLERLARHQDRYYQAGLELYEVAIDLMKAMKSKIKTMEMTTATARHVASALQSAADLEAHALAIAKLQRHLEQPEEDEEA